MNLTGDNIIFQLFHPFSMFVVGPKAAGKTTTLLNFIKRRPEIISVRLEKVFYIFGQDQVEYHKFAKENPDVKFSPIFDDELIVTDSLYIFDDQGMSISASSSMNSLITHIVTKCVNHSRISVVIVLHNLFGKNLRTISLSQDYIALFQYPRDISILSKLASQVFPGKAKYLKECYEFATRKAYSYLFLDLHVLQNNKLRVRTNIFNGDNCFILVPP